MRAVQVLCSVAFIVFLVNLADAQGSAVDAANQTTQVQLFNENLGQESRKSREGGGSSGSKPKKKKEEKGLVEKILPFFVIPFIMQSSLLPMMLISLKFMLMKTLFIGKMAVVLLLINMLWKTNNSEGGVYSHNINLDPSLSKTHYGYTGEEEYGAYVNRKRRK